MENNTFFITGGTGTIGKQVIDELLKAGLHVRTLTRNSSKTSFRNTVEVFEGDY